MLQVEVVAGPMVPGARVVALEPVPEEKQCHLGRPTQGVGAGAQTPRRALPVQAAAAS
jgi:hypothetical protein